MPRWLLAATFVLTLACAGCARPAVDARRPIDPSAACAETRGEAHTGARDCPLACRPEDAVDLDHSQCLPSREARALAERSAIAVAEDEDVGCARTERLAVVGGTLLCFPRSALCPRGSRWRGDRCADEPSCGAGEVAATSPSGDRPGRSRCVPIVGRDGVVDVGTWSRFALGDDGGVGSAELCGPIGRSVVALASPTPGGAVRLTIDLTFPDNEARGATARVRARVAGAADTGAGGSAGGPYASTTTETIAAESVASLLVPLRRLGGVTSAAFATVSVRCVLPAVTKPVTTPREPSAAAP